MKTAKAIIYDDTCPMCKWYTGAFVQAGLIEDGNRVSFSELQSEALVDALDLERSRDEIPLIDLNGQPTLYGVDGLVYLLGKRAPVIPRMMKIAPIDWFFRKLYKLVSYNRRVMAPSAPQKIKYDCAPHFNLKYRLLYLVTGGVVGTLLLKGLFGSLAIWGLVGMGFLPAFLFTRERAIEWMGQWSTILLIGGLLTLPGRWLPDLVVLFGGLVVGVMIWQLIRRGRLFCMSL